MIIKDIEWEKPLCNYCGSRKQKTLLNDVRYWEHEYSFKVVKCSTCGLIFLTPRPKQEFISRFYKTETYWGRNIKIKEMSEKEKRDKIYEPIYKLILNKRRRILEIGAGTGLFLSKFKDNKWRTDGVEFSKEAVGYAGRVFGLSLKIGDFLEHDFKKNYYDYVVMNNTLEHLYKPFETLKSINKILRKKGRIIIVVPNIDSLGYKIFKENWYPLQPPIHLYYFSPETLKMLLDSAGFKIKKISHSYYLHNFFSFFESFRSEITKRNYYPGKSYEKHNKTDNDNKKDFIKKFGSLFINVLSLVLSNIGSFLKKGETIIIIAVKE